MTSKILANGILRALGILLGIFLLGYFLYAIQSVIIYIIIAGILSLIARPVILFLRRKLKFPNTIAVVFTMVLMLGLLTGLFVMFIPLVAEQGKSLSLLEVDKLQENVQQIFNQTTAYFSSKGIDVLGELKNVDFVSQFKEIPNLLNSVLGAVGSLSVGLFSVLFISFFFMKDSQLLKKGVMTIIPNGTEGRFSKSLETINDLLSRYFIGLLTQITILFVLYTIILLVFDIDNAVVIAFLCALLNLIPYVGPMIGAVIMFMLSMISNIGLDFQTEILSTSLWIMFWYLIAQLVDNFASQPLIFSKTTKSHPLEIFLIIIIGGLLFGIVGMITAVPMYTALKVILKEFLSNNKIVKSLTKDL
ncbi:AI-2E family transporter [Polaribacter sp. SA4-12]|uniref:AI-2E family transporter n=1 Tax=Polaribacter sp. SA4-12 TaxID=1312072 RepID=UPI000B3C83FA|nr:AI-2E family transporter [Polaribacter sp. SA4-12]ARV13660.1 AI-2E family transporter [Polaribacter sp. SA4-12]